MHLTPRAARYLVALSASIVKDSCFLADQLVFYSGSDRLFHKSPRRIAVRCRAISSDEALLSTTLALRGALESATMI